MKSVLLIVYKVFDEMRASYKASRGLITMRQRAGNRYMNVFALTFSLSILMVLLVESQNYMVYSKEKQIEKAYLEYRRSVEGSISSSKPLQALT